MRITVAPSFFLFLFLERKVHPKCGVNFEIRRSRFTSASQRAQKAGRCYFGVENTFHVCDVELGDVVGNLNP